VEPGLLEAIEPRDSFIFKIADGRDRVARLPMMRHNDVGLAHSLVLFVAASTFKVSRLRVDGHEEDADLMGNEEYVIRYIYVTIHSKE